MTATSASAVRRPGLLPDRRARDAGGAVRRGRTSARRPMSAADRAACCILRFALRGACADLARARPGGRHAAQLGRDSLPVAVLAARAARRAGASATSDSDERARAAGRTPIARIARLPRADARRLAVRRRRRCARLRSAAPARAHRLDAGCRWTRAMARACSPVDEYIELPGHPGLPEAPVRARRARRLRRPHAGAPLRPGACRCMAAAASSIRWSRASARAHAAGFADAAAPGRRWTWRSRALARARPRDRALPGADGRLGAPARRRAGISRAARPIAKPLARLLRRRRDEPLRIVQPGSQLPSRRWPPERFAAVADALPSRGLRRRAHRQRRRGAAGRRADARRMRRPAIDLAGAHDPLGTLGALVEDADAGRLPTTPASRTSPRRWAAAA